MDFSQAARLIALDTVLGADVLLPIDLAWEDAISETFCASLTVFSTELALAPEELIGTRATLWIGNDPATRRPVNGFFKSFSEGPVGLRGMREYRADIVPWLWFLTCTADCRIFQNKSFPDVMELLFAEYGFDEYELRLTEAYQPIDFCVQYRESAFAFLSRWMEKLGIFYYWRHSDDRHVMVVADQNIGFFAIDAPIDYTGSGHGNVDGWERTSAFHAGSYAHTDYSFKAPTQNLLAAQSSLVKLPLADRFEIFDSPAGHTEFADGQNLARLRIEEQEAQYQRVRGQSVCRDFAAGGRAQVTRHEVRAEQDVAYIFARVSHRVHDETFYNTDAPPPAYSNSFVCVPDKTRYRPRRLTPWPVVHGPQTARVVGAAGETIFTDARGRVKLQFHWDRRGTSDERSSCWVRVSQNNAGAGWGGMFIPHVGHEVVVAFLEGDPDRPLVTGRVYNADNTQSIGLPADKTQSGLRDHSGNEIIMEGKGGAQDIRTNAVKDMNTTVQNDYNETVSAGNRTITIATGTHTETIKGNTKITVTSGALYVVVAANSATHQSKSTTTIVSTAADVHVQASTQIALDVGDSHILLRKDGTIALTGKNVTITGSESVTIQGNAIRSIADQEHEIKGAITVSEGVTTNTVKGAMVMLNPGS